MMTINDLKELAGVSGSCLSIYQPLRETHSQTSKPEQRIGLALQKAGQLLEQHGFSLADREDMLRPFEKIASNNDWTTHNGSLVMFRSPGFTMVNFWPDELPARLQLAPEFLVLPLLPGLFRQREFWLLALSIQSVKLYRGSMNGLVEVALPKGLAGSLRDDEAFDQPDHSERGRVSAGPSTGTMKGVQFGNSSAHELEATYLHDYFKEIDRSIRPLLAADPQPLILAGVQRELAIYRKVNSYPLLAAEDVHGSPESLGHNALLEKAFASVPPYPARTVEQSVRHMDAAASRGLLIWDPAAVVEAARLRQVEELIISPDAPGFQEHEAAINWAALATIRNSGAITILSAPQTPIGVAAVLRYTLKTGQGESRMIA